MEGNYVSEKLYVELDDVNDLIKLYYERDLVVENDAQYDAVNREIKAKIKLIRESAEVL